MNFNVILIVLINTILYATLLTSHPVYNKLDLFNSEISDKLTIKKSLTCELCKTIFNEIQHLFVLNKSEELIKKTLKDICNDLKLQDENVCNLVVNEFKDEVLTVIDLAFIDSNEACGIIVGPKCSKSDNPFNQSWDIQLTNVPKPPNKPMKLPKSGNPKLRILHVSDIHFDPEYTVGLAVECGEPLCCRPPNAKVAVNGSRKWGEFKCDSSHPLLINFMEEISSKQDEYDIVYVTGDYAPHNVWNQTINDQLTSLEYIAELFKQYLPKKAIYFAVGNHEGVPVNAFPAINLPIGQKGQWLRDAAAKSWSQWLPAEAVTTLKHGLFYTALVKPGLRMISLNTNYCNNKNWWLLINSTDPAGQLEWLIQVLQQAENNNEKVHIIGHIISAQEDCIEPWSRNYYKIILRYENTITAHFYGHVHDDRFRVYVDPQNISRPFGVVFTPGSVTPLTNLNPGFKIYTVDGEYNGSSWGVLDFSSYYLDLMQTDKTNNPIWNLQYNTTKVYGILSAFPQTMLDLIAKFEKDDTLFQTYINYKYKSAPHAKCEASCKKSTICEMRTGRSHDVKTFCPEMQPKDIDYYYSVVAKSTSNQC